MTVYRLRDAQTREILGYFDSYADALHAYNDMIEDLNAGSFSIEYEGRPNDWIRLNANECKKCRRAKCEYCPNIDLNEFRGVSV